MKLAVVLFSLTTLTGVSPLPVQATIEFHSAGFRSVDLRAESRPALPHTSLARLNVESPIGASTAQTTTGQVITPTVVVTEITPLVQDSPAITPTTIPSNTGVFDEPASSATPSETEINPERDAAYAGAIVGTVIANRSPSFVRFFVEGATYELDPQRSMGLDLPRPTAVLNLFNCDANAQNQAGCFWDPYLVTQNGFYEIVTGQDSGALVSLSLREASAPPKDQIWVQNRTGRREEIYYIDQMFDLAPSTVKEFTLPADGVGVFYLRTCVTANNENVCEWSAQAVEPGRYYALVEEDWRGNVANSTVTALQLRAIIGDGMAVIETPPQMACRVVVPTLNVRSGPGLSYDIIKKVRSTQAGAAIVTVVGRTEDSQWLAVDEREVDNGWVTSNYNFIRCDGDLAALPVVADVEPTPTPTAIATPTPPQTVRPQNAPAESAAPTSTPTPLVEEATATPEPAIAGVPAGYAQIVVNNGFDQIIRFTLDQRHRVDLGPSEYDLNPGDSVSFVVYPGQVAFSASTPWRGLSGQTEIYLDKDQTRVLWLSFIPDPGEPGEWILLFE